MTLITLRAYSTGPTEEVCNKLWGVFGTSWGRLGGCLGPHRRDLGVSRTRLGSYFQRSCSHFSVRTHENTFGFGSVQDVFAVRKCVHGESISLFLGEP